MYGDVPPAGVTVAAPVLLPKQNTFKTVVEVLNPAAGCVIVTLFAVVQALASVTVTVLSPAFKVVITDVVAAVDQR